MRYRTRITQIAHERGWTASEVARRVGFYRSNISAMDSGNRPVSIKALTKIAALLGVSTGELMERISSNDQNPFKQARHARTLHNRDMGTQNGAQKAWVNANMLAWQRHYKQGSKP